MNFHTLFKYLLVKISLKYQDALGKPSIMSEKVETHIAVYVHRLSKELGRLRKPAKICDLVWFCLSMYSSQ